VNWESALIHRAERQLGGEEVKYEDYRQVHDRILESDEWIVDGFGCLETLWARLTAADTLIYIDLPLPKHFLWVSKRLITGLFKNPEGWPENSPILKSSFNSYRILLLCHQRLTPKYREYVKRASQIKNVYHLKSAESISGFLAVIESQQIITKYID
jgi:hypothetical protein